MKASSSFQHCSQFEHQNISVRSILYLGLRQFIGLQANFNMNQFSIFICFNFKINCKWLVSEKVEKKEKMLLSDELCSCLYL